MGKNHLIHNFSQAIICFSSEKYKNIPSTVGNARRKNNRGGNRTHDLLGVNETSSPLDHTVARSNLGEIIIINVDILSEHKSINRCFRKRRG